ncbi:MAG: hypothetical protein H6961_10350 [Chromatiaceae bacterium]|nr:hypothetical protein [Chromatiaceae bacterium]
MEAATAIAHDVTAVVSESESGIFIIPKRETDTGKLRDRRRKEQAAHLVRQMQRAYDLDDLRASVLILGLIMIPSRAIPKRAKSSRLFCIFTKTTR